MGLRKLVVAAAALALAGFGSLAQAQSPDTVAVAQGSL